MASEHARAVRERVWPLVAAADPVSQGAPGVTELMLTTRHELQLLPLDGWTDAAIQQATKAAAARHGLKPKAVWMPLRYAATGTDSGALLSSTLALLGREAVLRRLDVAIQRALKIGADA